MPWRRRTRRGRPNVLQISTLPCPGSPCFVAGLDQPTASSWRVGDAAIAPTVAVGSRDTTNVLVGRRASRDSRSTRALGEGEVASIRLPAPIASGGGSGFPAAAG